MFDLTRQERKALLFIIIFITAGAVLKVLPFALSQTKSRLPVEKLIEDKEQKININTADLSRLTELSGIGSSIALRIVEHRKRHGPFVDPQELLDVKGIGIRKYQKIKDKIIL